MATVQATSKPKPAAIAPASGGFWSGLTNALTAGAGIYASIEQARANKRISKAELEAIKQNGLILNSDAVRGITPIVPQAQQQNAVSWPVNRNDETNSLKPVLLGAAAVGAIALFMSKTKS